jgi:hypothetical protein
MNLLCVENFSQESVSQVIRGLLFIDKPLGKEIDCFNFVDPNYDELFSFILREKVSLPKNWGFFRKSAPTIHFEDHSSETLFSAIIAVDDVVFRTHRHKQTSARTLHELHSSTLSDFIKNNCDIQENWEIENQIFIKKNSLFFFEPWYWHSFSEGIIQRFLVERAASSSKIDETALT